MNDKESEDKKYSWWEKRTKIEKCLVVLAICSALVIIFLASNLMMRFPLNNGPQQDICMTKTCIRSAAAVLEKMDSTVDPCDDFYKFACGNYIKNTIIPENKVAVSSFSDVGDKVSLQLMEIYEEPLRDNDPKILKLLKTVYKSCMNTTKIEIEGLDFVKSSFKELGGWPVLESNYWNEKAFDWKNVLYRLRRMGWRFNFFFSMYVGTDLRNSSRRILTISQPCLPYDRLKKGFNDTGVKAQYEYLINLATLCGADKLHAVAEMKEVMEFEMSLAKIIIPYEERKNASLQYHPMTIRALQRNFSSIPWLQFINSYLSPIDMFTSDDVVNVGLPKFLRDLEDLLLKTRKRILANFMFSRLVRDSVDHLPEAFRQKELEFIKILYGKNQVTPRWKTCVYETARMHLAVSALYVKKFFNKATKSKVSEVVSDIKTSFLETLKKVGWMDRKTKKHALQKADKMSTFIAYPEELMDDTKIEQYYEGLELNSSEYYLKIDMTYSTFIHMKEIKKLREPIIKPNWQSHAYSFYVNAFYDQSDNAIGKILMFSKYNLVSTVFPELPAAILQGHFFDPDGPHYMNYGAIGEVIGHEITHGFDDIGRQYDKDGNLIDWWEPETNRTFSRKSQCLVEQYGNFTIPELEINLNGVKTLGENIADNGGIKIAYRGYLKWMERNKAELSLPGLPYTPRQLFWIASGSNWCTKYKKEALKQQVTSGHHSPSYFRLMVPFMNSDYFARDFNCPLGSPMNPKYKCRVW